MPLYTSAHAFVMMLSVIIGSVCSVPSSSARNWIGLACVSRIVRDSRPSCNVVCEPRCKESPAFLILVVDQSLPSSGVEVAVSVVVSVFPPGCVFGFTGVALILFDSASMRFHNSLVKFLVWLPCFIGHCFALLLSRIHVHSVALLTRPLFCAFRTSSASASPASPASPAVSAMLARPCIAPTAEKAAPIPLAYHRQLLGASYKGLKLCLVKLEPKWWQTCLNLVVVVGCWLLIVDCGMVMLLIKNNYCQRS